MLLGISNEAELALMAMRLLVEGRRLAAGPARRECRTPPAHHGPPVRAGWALPGEPVGTPVTHRLDPQADAPQAHLDALTKDEIEEATT
jgi:hypothetical protein